MKDKFAGLNKLWKLFIQEQIDNGENRMFLAVSENVVSILTNSNIVKVSRTLADKDNIYSKDINTFNLTFKYRYHDIERSWKIDSIEKELSVELLNIRTEQEREIIRKICSEFIEKHKYIIKTIFDPPVKVTFK